VRQLAWLSATPKDDKKNRITQFREAEYTADQLDELYPDVGDAHYLVGLFYDSGIWTQTGMGNVPLSWQEIQAWNNVNEYELPLWTIKLIKQMSDTYCQEFSKSSELCQAPYTKEQEVVLESEEVVGNRVANQLRSMSNKKRE
jgi:hypothetical protein